MVELYGVLNKTLTPIKYTGATTDTAQVNIDQEKKTISVDVLNHSDDDIVFVKFYIDDGSDEIVCNKTYEQLGADAHYMTKQIYACLIKEYSVTKLPPTAYNMLSVSYTTHEGKDGLEFIFA